jgi:hypothetical protein
MVLGAKLMAIRPAIVSAGRTRFGEHYEKEPEKLIEEAWLKASQEANTERKSLEACYLSDYFLPITNKLGLEEGFLSELTDPSVLRSQTLATPSKQESTTSF